MNFDNTRQILNQAIISSPSVNSPYDLMRRGEGVKVSKVHTLDGAGAQTDNIFTVTGCVSAIIWGEVTSVTNSITCSSLWLETYDGAQVEITDNGGTDFSGAVIGWVASKDAAATVAITKTTNTVCTVTDGTAGCLMLRMPFRIIKKTATTTYIRCCFTGDADTNLQITWHVRYIPITSDGAIVAV